MNERITHFISSILMVVLCGCNSIDYQYLSKAIEVQNWLKNQKIDINGKEIWFDKKGSEKVSLSLSSGVAGKALFYLELYNATQKKEHLTEALDACDYLVEYLPKDINQAQELRNSTSLYGDITGGAFVLMEAFKVTKEVKWKNSVERCIKLIDQLSKQSDGRYWNKSSDVLVGSSGTGLFLLYFFKETGNIDALNLAIDAASIIEERAIINGDSLYWYINQDNEMNIPNFSHGAAGIGYFLTALYEETKDEHYLELARKIANYLEIIAWKPNDAFLIPYGFPDIGWEREYDIGWAHGPAGTARFFYKLWQVTQEKKWLELVRKCSNGIKLSGLPNTPNEHFGENPFPVDMRFGLGGVIEFYIHLKDLNIIDKNDNYLHELIAKLDSQAELSNTAQRYWKIKPYGFMRESNDDPVTFTGYFYGAAGLGRLYIKLYNLQNEMDLGIRLPDNPF